MASATGVAATFDDLARVEGKAEIIAGRIVHLLPTGRKLNRVAARIFRSLDDHAEATGRGEAFTHNMGFAVGPLRQSFSPDASYYLGPFPDNEMRLMKGSPHFAVEVRSDNEHGEAADAAIAAKRADYFEAGTLVVCDVDPIQEIVRKYGPDSPDPVLWGRGQEADAEPAVAGWRIAVDRIFG